MNIIFKLKENHQLSQKERLKILALLRSQVAGDVDLSFSDVSEEEGVDNSRALPKFFIELLMNNLTALQNDALELEEQISKLKERNDYLEEKVNWLRSKTGARSFIPSKVKSNLNQSLNNISLQSALVEVINKMEFKISEKVGLSFSKSKRARKDKALISKSEYFDKEYVAKQLKHFGLKVKDPLEFFISFGAELELSPSEKFDTKSYLAMNPDVKDSGINPLLHYIKHGKAEGRVLI